MSNVVLGLDLAAYRTGWAIGDGSGPPLAGAWLFPNFGGDLGALAHAFEEEFDKLMAWHSPVALVYESPLLMPHDRLLTLRRTYGLGMKVEDLARKYGLACKEEDPKGVKSVLTGNSYAKKPDMVKAARALGIALPRTIEDGQQDAADAAGCWMVAQREFGEVWAAWDARLRQMNEGAML